MDESLLLEVYAVVPFFRFCQMLGITSRLWNIPAFDNSSFWIFLPISSWCFWASRILVCGGVSRPPTHRLSIFCRRNGLRVFARAVDRVHGTVGCHQSRVGILAVLSDYVSLHLFVAVSHRCLKMTWCSKVAKGAWKSAQSGPAIPSDPAEEWSGHRFFPIF